MPAKRSREEIACRFFSWRLFQRGKTFYADGRCDRTSVGRHSLGTQDKAEAKRKLVLLDENIAVEHGLITKEAVTPENSAQLLLEAGIGMYRTFMARPEVSRGIRPSTRKRYRPVFAHFTAFCEAKRLDSWNQINRSVLLNYGAHLEGQGYAPRTVYLELTTIKQVIKFLMEEGALPPTQSFRLRMSKPQGSDVHCYTTEEVTAILARARSLPDMEWMYRALVGLAFTGLRIQELAGLRWSDISDDCETIHLTDEGYRSSKSATRRRTKSGRSRSLPVLPELKELLTSMVRDPGAFIFTSMRGCRLDDSILRNTFIRDVIKPLSRQFPSPDAVGGFSSGRLHSFRHFFCSQMANANTPIMALQQWLGHRNSAMVMHYYHLNSADAKKLMSSIRLLPRSEQIPGND